MARLAEIQNRQKELEAESLRKIRDAQTKAAALVAEEKGRIQAQVAVQQRTSKYKRLAWNKSDRNSKPI